MDHESYFRALGAKFVYHEPYPVRRDYAGREHSQGIFAHYYFLDSDREIGYYIPDLAPYSTCRVHPTPRVWGIPRNLVALKGE